MQKLCFRRWAHYQGKPFAVFSWAHDLGLSCHLWHLETPHLWREYSWSGHVQFPYDSPVQSLRSFKCAYRGYFLQVVSLYHSPGWFSHSKVFHSSPLSSIFYTLRVGHEPSIQLYLEYFLGTHIKVGQGSRPWHIADSNFRNVTWTEYLKNSKPNKLEVVVIQTNQLFYFLFNGAHLKLVEQTGRKIRLL